MITLPKSRFISGTQCEKKLYFDVFRQDLKPIISDRQQALFDSGHTIGLLARQVFPNGKDASPKNYVDFPASIINTRTWSKEEVQTIYEAAFSSHGVFAALDILHLVDGERWAIEVKGSTQVKPYHVFDASIQYWVMNQSGITPDKFFIMHINNKYVKQGQIDPIQLFHLEDITELVLANQDWVGVKKDALIEILETKMEPVKDIGKHCSDPFQCEYITHCWSHIPKNSVFDLYNSRGKEWIFYEQGIIQIQDIPFDFKFSHRQQMQVNAVKFQTNHIDAEPIREMLSQCEYPLYFFDFETINPAIPVLNGTSPFNQVPFQYSLHVTNEKGDLMDYKSFLANPNDFNNIEKKEDDPRYKLIMQLKADIKESGRIIAYNAPFEVSVLKGLAALFPEEKEFLEDLNARFIDLLIPFKKAWYYLADMGSSASIKYVLPAIAPEFSYYDLEINNGGMASETFLAMIHNPNNEEDTATRINLLKYCERDTEGMVVIYKHLLDIITAK